MTHLLWLLDLVSLGPVSDRTLWHVSAVEARCAPPARLYVLLEISPRDLMAEALGALGRAMPRGVVH